MKINEKEYDIIDVYDLSITVPDSFVVNDNKTCEGHGEAKLYMGSKEHMRNFYAGDVSNKGFVADCVVLKADLLQYMQTASHEYNYPSTKYRGQGTKTNISHLWKQRIVKVKALPNVLFFKIKDQDQIIGNRGYVKTKGDTMKGGYGIVREISLPFVSYISIMKLQNTKTNEILFYWKLFTDFSQMAEQQYIAKNYGKKKSQGLVRIRDGQVKYRQGVFNQFQCCPFTQIDDIRLLVASHIKPWAVCSKIEQTDLFNGFMLSPLYDKLFDKGYITFEDDGRLIISAWLSPDNRKRIDFSYKVSDLHLTPQRRMYLDYHRKYVFKH